MNYVAHYLKDSVILFSVMVILLKGKRCEMYDDLTSYNAQCCDMAVATPISASR